MHPSIIFAEMQGSQERQKPEGVRKTTRQALMSPYYIIPGNKKTKITFCNIYDCRKTLLVRSW